MYTRAQKESSSVSPTSIHKKSNGSDGSRSFSVQRQQEINSSPEKERPSYSRNAADLLAANVMRSMEEGKDSDEMSLEAGVQTKLTVGAAGDKYEQEADQVAAQVMRMSVAPDNSPQVQRFGEEDNPVQRWSLAQSITPVVQRQVDEQVQMRSLVQRAFQAGGNQASGDLESRLNASKGGGSALAPEVRAFMEPRFGADFSSVRVHTGSEAVQMNRELGAQAFAHGSDIYFGAGKSPGNNELTAHELTHVVQQKGISHIQREAAPSNHEKMLDEAINILQHALKALAAQTAGEGNADMTATPQAKQQEQGLRTALNHLLALKGSGKVDDIISATQPILAASKGDSAGASPASIGQPSPQESSEGSTPNVQRAATLALGTPLLAAGPPGWAAYAALAVGTLIVGGIIAYEISRTRTETETPANTGTTVSPPVSVPVPPTTVAPPISQPAAPPTTAAPPVSVPRAVPRAVPRTRTRRRRRGPYPINWPYFGGRGLPLVAPNPVNSIFVNRRLVRTTPPPRNLALIDQFKATHAVQTGQAVHHVTPLFLGGPDALGNLVALWMSYHNRGHAALRNQPHLAAYGISTDLYQHPPGTLYIVSAIV
jgi:hypothetical protein